MRKNIAYSPRLIVLFFTLLITTLSACSSPGEDTTTDYFPQDFSAASGALDAVGSAFTDLTEWPDYIPADIPELEGDISSVMVSPESHIRIFYENVTDRQIEDYLSLLEDLGFEFTYIIYTQEGFPDRSEERQENMDYDAIDITKDPYHMNLSSGAGTAVYDVYTSGFEDLVEQAMVIVWPDALVSNLPQPERCELTSIFSNDQSGFVIVCTCEDQTVRQDYAYLLQSQGFSIIEESTTNEDETIPRKLQKEALAVTLSGNCGPSMTIETESIDTSAWPEVFTSELPHPANCTLIESRTAGANTTYVDCKPDNDDVLTNYAAALEEVGFSESNRLLNQDNEPFMIVLVNDQDMITLSLDDVGFLTITIHLEP